MVLTFSTLKYLVFSVPGMLYKNADCHRYFSAKRESYGQVKFTRPFLYANVVLERLDGSTASSNYPTPFLPPSPGMLCARNRR